MGSSQLDERLQQWGIYLGAVEPSPWDQLAGMDLEKSLIENKIVLPLQHPQLAHKHGVVLPKAILLFGPPGTGKTSFSRGIAGKLNNPRQILPICLGAPLIGTSVQRGPQKVLRLSGDHLGWAFVEVSPSEMVTEGLHRQASRLRTIFELLQGIQEAVIFFDEFEELALRPERASTTGRMVASEMLKQIPRFRQAEGVLLICATNNIRLLNPALLRPGRFDFILPVGPLDVGARREVFLLCLQRMNLGQVDLDRVLERARHFTPADIQAVCAQAAQDAFEAEVASGQDYKVGTENLLRAIAGHRPTISPEDLDQIRQDIREFCRADYCRLLLGE